MNESCGSCSTAEGIPQHSTRQSSEIETPQSAHFATAGLQPQSGQVARYNSAEVLLNLPPLVRIVVIDSRAVLGHNQPKFVLELDKFPILISLVG
jgi:hypothetical protein